MGIKYDVKIEIKKGDKEQLTRAIELLNKKYKMFNENFTLESYLDRGNIHLRIEPEWIILDSGELPWLEALGEDLSKLEIVGLIKVLYRDEGYFICVSGDGNYSIVEYPK